MWKELGKGSWADTPGLEDGHRLMGWCGWRIFGGFRGIPCDCACPFPPTLLWPVQGCEFGGGDALGCLDGVAQDFAMRREGGTIPSHRTWRQRNSPRNEPPQGSHPGNAPWPRLLSVHLILSGRKRRLLPQALVRPLGTSTRALSWTTLPLLWLVCLSFAPRDHSFT